MSNIKISGNLTSLKFTLFKYKKILVIYDRKLGELAGQIAGSHPSFPIIAEEQRKTMETVISICRWLLSEKADKDTLLLAIGGGVITDIAGFAASIFKRGIRYANVPTTLLAMVDASIGGKTAVNLDSYKNMLGVIRQPEFTFIYTKSLETLPKREMMNGAVEMLKTFIIKNRHDSYSRALQVLRNPDYKALEPLIKEAAKIKMDIVRKDEFESGARRSLNLGHTFAHAIEWWQYAKSVENPMSHGEAVAVGIVRAAQESAKRGYCEENLPLQLRRDFMSLGLPVDMPCSDEELSPALCQDKKNCGGKINFVFIKRIGKVVIKKTELTK